MAEEAVSSLYHMVQKDLWFAVKESSQPYYPPTYNQDGFIHLTADPTFLLGVGNHFYRDVPGDFLLLVLDPAKLRAKVVFEPAAPVGDRSSSGLLSVDQEKGSGQEAPLFPHLYGTIDYDAVQSELVILRNAEGTFVSIPGLMHIADSPP